MHAAPAVSVTVPPSKAWRAALVGWAALLVVATCAWAAQYGTPLAYALPALLLCAVAVLLRRAWRRPPLRLAWDGQGWQLGAAADGSESRRGCVAIAMDLGPWILLHFRADSFEGAGRRSVWLPLARAGLASQWHALRCALYSPRPAASAAATTEPSP
jgi:hypothetical protein